MTIASKGASTDCSGQDTPMGGVGAFSIFVPFNR